MDLWSLVAGFGAGLAVYAGWRRFRRWRRGNTYDHSAFEMALKSAGEALPHIAWMAAPDGQLRWVNKKWLEYTGGTFADMEGERWRSIVHPDYLDLFARAWADSRRTERAFECSCLLRARDGTYRWFLVRGEPMRSARGEILCWFGTDTDIHSRVETEARHRHESELLHSLADAIPQLVWRTNPDGAADFFSRAFLEYLECSSEEVLGWGWAKLIHPEDRAPTLQDWEAARESGSDITLEFRIKSPHSGYRWILPQGKPFRDRSGRVIKYYGTWTDIDDLKNGQRELRRALGVRDEFISLASHELKTPITSMKLQTQMLDRSLRAKGLDALNPVQLGRMLQMSNQALDRLTRLVDDMLDITRIGAGRLSIERAPTDLNEEVRSAVERFSERLEASGSAVELDLAPEIRGNWDGFRVEQVVNNLLSNAIKYGQGRPIRIRTCMDAPGAAVLMVEDQGIGVPPDASRRIFERYERAVSSPHMVGLGLGLYIVKTIVDLHGGSIDLASEPGNGAKFTVRLPLDH